MATHGRFHRLSIRATPLARRQSMNHNSGGCRRAGPHRRGAGRVLTAFALVVAACAIPATSASAAPVPAATYASGVTSPFNGVWLDSADGGHYWDASGDGLCRVDASPASPGGFAQNTATCDVQAKKPTQAVVDPKTMSTTSSYFVYSADMSSKSGGPL